MWRSDLVAFQAKALSGPVLHRPVEIAGDSGHQKLWLKINRDGCYHLFYDIVLVIVEACLRANVAHSFAEWPR